MPLDVDRIAVRGEWIRHAPHRSALLGRAIRPTAKRWQRDEVVRALYLADEPATAVAEWYRFLAERGMWPGAAVPHDHHRWELRLELADLSTPRRLAAVGLAAPTPLRADWEPYQLVGEALWREGWRGVLAPSAARPSAKIVCIFADDWPPAGCVPVGADELLDVPVPPTGTTT
jgi:RES domain-containing protein